MLYKQSLLVTALAIGVIPAMAQSPSAKALVESGVNAYIKGDATGAMKAWLKGSCMEGNQEALSQANLFRQVEELYGKAQSFDLIAEVPLTPKVKFLYFVINMEKGALFCRFQVYEKAQGGWVSGRVDFHTEASKILTPAMMQPH